MNAAYNHIGLWRYAVEFFYAAIRLDDEQEFSVVVYYLYCHSIELVLKSLLAFNGFKEKHLKKIGHDLNRAFNKAIKLNPDIFKDIQYYEKIKEAITMISPYYKEKEFEYIKTGLKRFPTLQDLRSVVEELLVAIGKGINIPESQLNKLIQKLS